jgi:RNA polymerase-binding protein DksA
MTKAKPTKEVNAGLPKRELEALRRQLLVEREQILELYNHDLHAGQALHEGPEDDLADRAIIDHEREMIFTLSDAEREQLRQIDEALERMDAGTYGRCEYTGKPIPLERLRVLPWARLRADVQQLEEEGIRPY